MENTDNAPPKKLIYLFPLLAGCRSEMLFFLLPSIHALFESVYGKKKKKALPLLNLARSGKWEMYFFLGALSFFSTWGYVILQETGSNIWLGGLFSALFLTEKFVELELKFTPGERLRHIFVDPSEPYFKVDTPCGC